MCGKLMEPVDKEIPPPAPGFALFDHTYTPEHASLIVSQIPDDSYHWVDIPRKRPGTIEHFTRIMSEGRWVDQTLARGFHVHPIHFDHNGLLQHGAMRLIACRDSGVSFSSVTLCPIGLLPEVFSWPTPK
jgi:hypothetical protein